MFKQNELCWKKTSLKRKKEFLLKEERNAANWRGKEKKATTLKGDDDNDGKAKNGGKYSISH